MTKENWTAHERLWRGVPSLSRHGVQLGAAQPKEQWSKKIQVTGSRSLFHFKNTTLVYLEKKKVAECNCLC